MIFKIFEGKFPLSSSYIKSIWRIKYNWRRKYLLFYSLLKTGKIQGTAVTWVQSLAWELSHTAGMIKKKKDNVYFVLLGHAQVIFFMKLISVFFPKLRGSMEKWKNKNQEASWVYKLFICLLSYAEWKRKAWRVNKRIGNEFYPCLGNLTGKAGRSWQPLLSRSQHREPSRS